VEVVGRAAELAVIDVFLDGTSGGFAALVFEGQPGIGKTTLWSEAVRRGTERGYTVLSCRPTAAEATLSYTAVGDLLEPVEDGVYGALPAPQRVALDGVLLRNGAGGRPPARRTVSVAFLSVLRALTTVSPVLVAVDDAQWLDQPSAAVLGFAVRRLDAELVRVVAAVRLGADTGASGTFDRQVGESHRQALSVSPLSRGALHTLLTGRLGSGLTRPDVMRISEASGGNPFYALEIGREFLRAHAPAGAPVPVPADVNGLVVARIRRLPAGTRRALLMCATSGAPTVQLVGEAPLGPAEDAGIVRVMSDGAVRFSHPLFALAVYGSSSARSRGDVHRQLASLVDDEEERARHLALATTAPSEAVAQAVEEGAAHARARGAWESAGELFEHARRLTPPGHSDVAHGRATAAAEHHVHAGNRTRARRLLEELLDEPLAQEMRADALRLLGEISSDDESWAEAERLLVDALAHTADPGLAIRVQLGLSYVRCAALDFAGGDLHVHQALERAEAFGDPALLAEPLAFSAVFDYMCGRGVDWDKVERSVALEDPDRIVPVSWRPTTVAALLHLYVGRLSEARRRLRQIWDSAVDRGDESDLSFIAIWLSWLATWSGDFATAAALADEAASLATLTGSRSMQAWALAQRAYVRAHRGEVAETRRDCAEANALLRSVGLELPRQFLAASLGLLENSLGDAAAAWHACEPLTVVLEQAGIAEPIPAFFLTDALEALIALGQLDRAEALVDVLEARGRELDRAWALATAARCRGLLLAVRGDLADAAASLDAALTEHKRLEMPFERARVLMAKGLIERRARHRGSAKESLQEAAAVFQGLGAALWAQRARKELDRVGIRRPSGDDLTASERRVAELAATGMKNHEVAAALFISAKTVEANLARVYRKLGITSRAELGSRMADHSET
jgi:DNA-binding CsgD family transcriptional regulator/tetratricopeptide (TPR) repeat protein